MTLHRRLSITLTLAVVICATCMAMASFSSIHANHQYLASERIRHNVEFVKNLLLARLQQELSGTIQAEPTSLPSVSTSLAMFATEYEVFLRGFMQRSSLQQLVIVDSTGTEVWRLDNSNIKDTNRDAGDGNLSNGNSNNLNHTTPTVDASLNESSTKQLAPNESHEFSQALRSEVDPLISVGAKSLSLLPSSSTTIPSWVTTWLPLNQEAHLADLSQGVKRFASLKVMPDLDLAYQYLWNDLKQYIVILCWVTLLLIIFLQMLLFILLSPLKKLIQQGTAVANNQWQQPSIYHLSGDLKLLQKSFYSVSSRLQELWARQLKLIDQLFYDNYHDPLSGLLNRRGFDHRLEHVQQHYESQHGLLMIVQLCNLNLINQGHGRRAGDDVISTLGKLIKHWQHEHHNSFCGRHSATDITLYTPCSDINQAQDILQQTYTRIGLSSAVQQKDLTFYIGGFYFADNNLQVTRVMSQADAALDIAKQQIDRRLHLISEDDDNSALISSQQWPELLQQIAQQGSIIVKFRPTMMLPVTDNDQANTVELNSTRCYLTAAAYLPNDSGELSMARYWPLVEHHQLTVDFDLCLLQQSLTKLAQHSCKDNNNHTKLVVPISPASLVDERFYQNIIQLVRRHPHSHSRLILQVPEFCIGQYQASLVRLAYLLESFNIKLAVYQVINSQALQLSQAIPLEFIAIDSRYCRAIHHLPEQCFMVKSIVQAARYRDIPVFIDGVSDELEYLCISDIGVSGASGRYIAAEQDNTANVVADSIST